MKREIYLKEYAITAYCNAPAGISYPYAGEFVHKIYGKALGSFICDWSGKPIKIGDDVCCTGVGQVVLGTDMSWVKTFIKEEL